MEDAINSIISRIEYIRPGAETAIVSCLIENCILKKNINTTLDYNEIFDYANQRHHGIVEISDAHLRLTESDVILVDWERQKINGSIQTIGNYYLNKKIRQMIAEYLGINETIKENISTVQKKKE